MVAKGKNPDQVNMWVGASELAGLPGLPTSKRGVLLRATREGWTYSEEPAQGGQRRMYAVTGLPTAIRQALMVRSASEKPAGRSGSTAGVARQLQGEMCTRATERRQLESLGQSVTLDSKAQARMDAKLQVLVKFDAFSMVFPGSVLSRRVDFAARYNAGQISGLEDAQAVIPRVSVESLARWHATVKKKGIAALGGAYGNRKGASVIDNTPTLRDFVVGFMAQYPHARGSHVSSAIRARFKGAPFALPGDRALLRWMDQWRSTNAQTLLALANPDAWKNKHMVAFGSQSEGVTRLNQRWELDSTPGDVMLKDGRHVLVAGIDVYSRRPRILVSKTSKATSVATLLRHMLLEHGVPEVAKTDNGTDYTSKHIVRVFQGLGIDHQLCPPFQPWHKPHIERFFKTFSHDVLELLPGFIGHDVAQRSAIEARKSFADRLMKRGEAVQMTMTADELQAFCDRWVDAVYMHREHASLNGATPFEMVTGWVEPVRTIPDERALDVLLAEAAGSAGGWLTVQKKGLRADSAYFIAPELEAFVGQRVRALCDPADLGRLYVYAGEDLAFLCIAECPERTGMDRREVATMARQMQKDRVQRERKTLRASARKVGTDQIVEEILTERAEAAGKLHRLPANARPHESDGLEQAKRAVRVATARTGDTADLMRSDKFRESFEKLTRELTELPQPIDRSKKPEFESEHHRIGWLIDQRRRRGLTPEETAALERLRTAYPASYQRLDQLRRALWTESNPGNLRSGTEDQ
jgi:putative transposase